jgi:predicted outer membrane repeat protein
MPHGQDLSGNSSISEFGVADLQLNYQPAERHHITGGVLTSVNGVKSRNMFGNRSAFGGAVYAQDEFTFIYSDMGSGAYYSGSFWRPVGIWEW